MNQVQRNMACREIDLRIRALCKTIESAEITTWLPSRITEWDDYRGLSKHCSGIFRDEAKLCLAACRRYDKARKKEERRLEKLKAKEAKRHDKRLEKIYALRDRLKLQVQFAECYEELQTLLDQIPKSV